MSPRAAATAASLSFSDEAERQLARAGAIRPELQKALLAWFDVDKRDLPWRRRSDAYAIWLSEVMLQQTQVATVIPYFERFLTRFPDVFALAEAAEPDVMALWKGLGYYSRARNLHRCAQHVARELGGVFPASADALLELPSFGRYTAGAVSSIAFRQNAPLVDGNVMRVLTRLFAIEGAVTDRLREKHVWNLASVLVQGKRPGDWNQSLMELGARVCRPESPRCHSCPMATHCEARAQERQAALPPPKVRAARKVLRMLLVYQARGDGRFLMARRKSGGLFGGLWELPAVEWDGENVPDAELDALFGQKLKLGETLGGIERTLTHRQLLLTVVTTKTATRPAGLAASAPYAEVRFVGFDELGALGFSTAMEKALELLPRQPLRVTDESTVAASTSKGSSTRRKRTKSA